MRLFIAFSVLALTSSAIADDDDALPEINAPEHWCRSFDVTGNSTRMLYENEVRISAAAICPQDNRTAYSDTTCPIPTGGFWYQLATYNISSANVNNNTLQVSNGSHIGNEVSSGIDWSIYKATADTRLYFSHPAIGAFPNQTLSIGTTGPVTAGYVTFTNTYRCLTGVLNDCSAGWSITNGTAIEACAPVYTDDHVDGIPVYMGEPTIVYTNVTYASTLTTNPNEQLPADQLIITRDGGAVSKSASGAMVGFVALIAVLVNIA